VNRIVLLDDYQGVALDYGGWDRIPDDWQAVALEHHIDDADELVEALAGAEIVVAMRERTPFPAPTLERLPDLKLLVTTGMANVAIDVGAANADGRARLGADPLPAAEHPRRGRGDARRHRPLADDHRR
jgi:phosphoglycerate dehydrogenase-like enzyme